MTDENMVKECAFKGFFLAAGINPPSWINQPKKPVEEPIMCVSIEVVEELQDDLKTAKWYRNAFFVAAVLFLIGDVWLSYLAGVW